MKRKSIEHIIRQFFENRFSKVTMQKFAWWMVNSPDEEQTKDAVMQELWEESVGSLDINTLSDLNKIRAQIHPKKNRWHMVKSIAAASIAIIPIISVLYILLRNNNHDNQNGMIVVSAPYGQIMEIMLEDSTSVVLNSGSSLIYPEHFANNSRQLFLTGEATFDVHRDVDRPFVVETPCFKVQALGTKFEVDAYSDSRTLTTTLLEGKTKVMLHDAFCQTNEKEYYLEPNQSFRINKVTGDVSIEEVDTERQMSWTQGDMIFEGNSFKSILETMERKYGVVFICEHLELMDGVYYAKFRSEETVNDVLDVLNQLSHHYKYKIDSDTIFIYPLKK